MRLRRARRAGKFVLEFADPQRDLPPAGTITTYRRGTKWRKAMLGADVLCIPAHGQAGPRRQMRVAEIELLFGRDLPMEAFANLSRFYPPISPDDEFVRLTLEAA